MSLANSLEYTSVVVCLSQLSTVVCYGDKHGDISKIFINLNEISDHRIAATISYLSIRQLYELSCLKKNLLHKLTIMLL